jgi:transcriptional regulator with XRE-family HTH domain
MKCSEQQLERMPSGNPGRAPERDLTARSFEKVLRLLDALRSLGWEEDPGFCTRIAKATSYSKSRVSDILSGKAPLNSRFVKAVCATFGTSEEYILQGTGEMSVLPERANSFHGKDGSIREAVSVLESMTEPDRCRAVALLKAMRKTFPQETSRDVPCK